MALDEKEIIKTRVHIKHNLNRLVAKTKWSKPLEELLLEHSIFDSKTLENIKGHSNRKEQLYHEFGKLAYCYQLREQFQTLGVVLQESGNYGAAEVLRPSRKSTERDRVRTLSDSGLCMVEASQREAVEITCPELSLLKKKITWSKHLENKLLEHHIFDSDTLDTIRASGDAIEKFYDEFYKHGLRQGPPNKDFMKLF